jgi:hypothetical protein
VVNDDDDNDDKDSNLESRRGIGASFVCDGAVSAKELFVRARGEIYMATKTSSFLPRSRLWATDVSLAKHNEDRSPLRG